MDISMVAMNKYSVRQLYLLLNPAVELLNACETRGGRSYGPLRGQIFRAEASPPPNFVRPQVLYLRKGTIFSTRLSRPSACIGMT